MDQLPRALIVDDDADNLTRLAETFRTGGYTVETANDFAAARDVLLKRMPEIALMAEQIDGDDVVNLLESVDLAPVMEIYLMSDAPSVKGAARAMRLGVSDYFVKPVDRGRLEKNLKNLASELGGDAADDTVAKSARGLLIGESPVMQRLYRLIRKCAPSEATVLLVGESGTGKELIAQTVHQLSPRANGDFVALNCSAVPRELMESEMFGHKKGSFTGAARDHRGYFERAARGTLFLDEITEMPLDLQAKLLRVLEEGTVMPVGSEREVAVHPRIVAATNQDPEAALAEGRLREDLYYRLAQFPLRVPSLRERGGDLVLLAQAFLERHNAMTGIDKTLSEDALETLRMHDWPGNVRELKNAVLHGHLLGGAEIRGEDLPSTLPSSASPHGDYLRIAIGTALGEVERRMILATLEHFDGDKKRAAETLGISLKTLYNRLKAYRSR